MLLALTLTGFLFTSGCTTYSTTTPGATAGSNDQIEDDVIERLRQDDLTSTQGFGVRIEGGIATLYGSVPDEIVRLRALGIVRSTPGVKEVVDKLHTW